MVISFKSPILEKWYPVLKAGSRLGAFRMPNHRQREQRNYRMQNKTNSLSIFFLSRCKIEPLPERVRSEEDFPAYRPCAVVQARLRVTSQSFSVAFS